MRSLAMKLCLAMLAGSVMLVAAEPAEARHDRGDHREWRKDQRSHGSGWGQQRKYTKQQQAVVTRPVGRHTVVEHHHYYPAPQYRHTQQRYAPPRHAQQRYAPPHRYGPPVTYYPYPVARNPAIIISVPPIVIPLR